MSTRNEKIQDSAEATVAKTGTTASLAVARLRRYESDLRAELNALNGDVVSDLVAYANTGKPGDIPERAVRAQAIRTVLAAIPQAVARIETERSDILRMNAETANADKRKAAVKVYREHLAEFDARYSKLAHSRDKSALHRAADELVRLAREAGRLTDLRLCLKRGKWQYRHRVNEVASRV